MAVAKIIKATSVKAELVVVRIMNSSNLGGDPTNLSRSPIPRAFPMARSSMSTSMANTTHRICLQDASKLSTLEPESVQLVVTSPPYPMIAMWDAMFSAANPGVARDLANEKPWKAFQGMHGLLDRVWKECHRVLIDGGIACINIGDATRTIGGNFQLFPNHARILSGMQQAGLSILPDILWSKPNNSPNKFMGSGMLPTGAYATYEHEYILVFRKGAKREFKEPGDKENRQASAYFWEERNLWFSDTWRAIKGISQSLVAPAERNRSAAFPLELPLRLILMYSVYGDVVLDPFLGTGTTVAAAMAAARNSVGFEADPTLKDTICNALEQAVPAGRVRTRQRLIDHAQFVTERLTEGREFKYINTPHNMPVMTRQEQALHLREPTTLSLVRHSAREFEFRCGHREACQPPQEQQQSLF